MNTIIVNQNKIFDELTDKYLTFIQSIRKLSYINSTDNLIYRITDINDIIDTLTTKISDLQHDIDLKHIQPSPNTEQRIYDYVHVQNVMKPFIPYMLLYSIALEFYNSNQESIVNPEIPNQDHIDNFDIETIKQNSIDSLDINT
jgi:hypothetical protein